jgi:hypothetical protein
MAIDRAQLHSQSQKRYFRELNHAGIGTTFEGQGNDCFARDHALLRIQGF